MDSNSHVENNIDFSFQSRKCWVLSRQGRILELLIRSIRFNDFLSGKLGRENISKLEYNINLNILEAKVMISASLPHSYPETPAQISVHSGHLGRINHNGINLELRNFQRTLKPGSIYIGSVVEWLKKTFRMWIHSHHIYSKSKMKNIEDWAKELNLTGFFLPGKPGFMCVEGLEANCNIWWQRRGHRAKFHVQRPSACESPTDTHAYTPVACFLQSRGPERISNMDKSSRQDARSNCDSVDRRIGKRGSVRCGDPSNSAGLRSWPSHQRKQSSKGGHTMSKPQRRKPPRCTTAFVLVIADAMGGEVIRFQCDPANLPKARLVKKWKSIKLGFLADRQMTLPSLVQYYIVRASWWIAFSTEGNKPTQLK
uniref:Small nuclear ribonucleoprotein Prp3 C-terminal domain-containing protein n=1 Tax=Daphnia galeata TaxID=27404 RepID=A0A8J2WAK9_9CRUS|nr:unnamed protein product [Daphnia galeata]